MRRLPRLLDSSIQAMEAIDKALGRIQNNGLLPDYLGWIRTQLNKSGTKPTYQIAKTIAFCWIAMCFIDTRQHLIA